MINIKHILESPDRDRLLRELIVPKPWKHELDLIEKDMDDDIYKCDKCGEELVLPRNISDDADMDIHDTAYRVRFGKCKHPDRIALDWNLAMKMFRDAYAQNQKKLLKTMIDIAHAGSGQPSTSQQTANNWFIFFAQPHHRILAALKAKEVK